MKKELPTPLTIDCDGLSRKRTLELFGRLRAHFERVDLWGDDTIIASKPLDLVHYDVAWQILDRYGVKVD